MVLQRVGAYDISLDVNGTQEEFLTVSSDSTFEFVTGQAVSNADGYMVYTFVDDSWSELDNGQRWDYDTELTPPDVSHVRITASTSDNPKFKPIWVGGDEYDNYVDNLSTGWVDMSAYGSGNTGGRLDTYNGGGSASLKVELRIPYEVVL